MTLNTHPRPSIWQAWLDADAESYRPRPYVAPTRDAQLSDIAGRIAAMSSAVTHGREDIGHVTAAVLAAFTAVDAATDAGRDDVADVLADVLAGYGIDGDDILPAAMSDSLAPDAGEYRDADTSTMTAPAAAFPTTATHPVRPHSGRGIRGRRVGLYVMGGSPAGLVADIDVDAATAGLSPRARRRVLASGRTYARIDADAALDIAGEYGTDVPALLGTDDYAWHQMVTYKPDTFAVITTDGRQVTFTRRPYGAGESVAGAGDMATSGRRRPARVLVMPTYRAKPVATSTRETDGRTWQVSHYRTSHHGRYIDAGTGRGWQETERARRIRVARPKPATATRERAAADVATLAKNDGRPYSLRYLFDDGTRALVRHEPDKRRWRVEITYRMADGTRARVATTARHIDKVTAAVLAAATSAPKP